MKYIVADCDCVTRSVNRSEHSRMLRMQFCINLCFNCSCEVAISSIIKRKDELAAKVDSANQIIRSICDKNNWTYIDNHAVTQLKADKLHPNDKGVSFLARNFQDFLRCVHPALFRHHQGMKTSRTFSTWLQYLVT